MNPYLPLDEYVPDGEPHVFADRLYIYGSHDQFKGTRYCPFDYVCYSCDIHDLTNWRYEGVIYRKDQDPHNVAGTHDLYAPDVVEGNDGAYYLYYALDGVDAISVAKAGQPAGPFHYYGTVRFPSDKTARPDYPACFDPGVINDDGHIYLAFGFSVDFPIAGMNLSEQNTRGAYIVELADDMLTMKHEPVFVIPGVNRGQETSFAKHEFLEASSLRKFGDTYYFIYSSQAQHELCYATAASPLGPYTYRGVLVSNAMENGSYRNNWANNHGSLVRIGDDYYIFYHRHTCGTQYSRQGCVQKIQKTAEGFQQAEIDSAGFQDWLPDGKLAAGYATFLYDQPEGIFIGFDRKPLQKARIEKDIIVNLTRSIVIYRYFAQLHHLVLHLSGPFEGKVSLWINGEPIATAPLAETVEFFCKAHHCAITLQFDAGLPVVLHALETE